VCVLPRVELGLRSEPLHGARKEAALPTQAHGIQKGGQRSPQPTEERRHHREAKFIEFEFLLRLSAFQGSFWSATQRLATRFTPSSFFQRGVFATESLIASFQTLFLEGPV